MGKNNSKIELTEQIRKRLKEEQKKAKMTNKRVAAMLGINETTYKNLIRISDGNKKIKEQIIMELATYYKCSSDYLKCLSDDPHTNQNGRPLLSALDYKERDKMIDELFHYFKENPETCSNIHFLLCELSDAPKKEIISVINSISNFLRCCFLFSCPANMTDTNLKNFLSGYSFTDPIYATSARTLMVANYLFENKNYQSALPEYVKIVYQTITQRSTQTNSIAKEACNRIIELKNKWDKFPSELYSFADELPTIEKHTFIERHFPNETKIKVECYLKNFSINLST